MFNRELFKLKILNNNGSTRKVYGTYNSLFEALSVVNKISKIIRIEHSTHFMEYAKHLTVTCEDEKDFYIERIEE